MLLCISGVNVSAGLDKTKETCYFYIRFSFYLDKTLDIRRLMFGDTDMKKMVIVILILLVPAFALAESRQSQARWNLVQKAGGFTAGVISGIVFHELGHYAVARAEGVNIEWTDGANSRINSANDSQNRNISVAGFGAQILSTEVILRSESIPKDNSYVLGWLTYNIVNQIVYPIHNELSSNGYKDLCNYERHGGHVRVLEVGLIAHAIWSFYRLKNNPDTPIFIRATRNEVGIGLGWKFYGSPH